VERSHIGPPKLYCRRRVCARVRAEGIPEGVEEDEEEGV